MSKLAEFGLTITTDAKKRWLIRRGTPVAITQLQRDMLEWLDGAVTPSLEYCCDELWEAVDPEWVRGQWDRLSAVMQPLGVTVTMDESDNLFLCLVDVEGGPVAPALEDGAAEVDIPEAGPTQAEIERDQALAEIAALELQIEQYREAAAGQLVIVNQVKAALAERDQLLDQVTMLKEVNDTLASMRRDALDRLEKAEAEIKRLQQAQPSVEVVQLRNYPVRIAPRYLTVAVSEPLFRWLEAAGDRNRRSADDMARALLVAFMRSAGNREAA